jgi:hypothetical protein
VGITRSTSDSSSVYRAGSVEAHRAGQPAVEFGVADGLADRLDRGFVPPEPAGDPRRARCRATSIWVVAGSSEVGVAGGVGAELVVHHGEQVVAGEAAADAVGIRAP